MEGNIVAAFRGMHVSPAKHSYAWLPRKCDYRTDTHTDRQTPDKVIPMCRYASQATQKQSPHKNDPYKSTLRWHKTVFILREETDKTKGAGYTYWFNLLCSDTVLKWRNQIIVRGRLETFIKRFCNKYNKQVLVYQSKQELASTFWYKIYMHLKQIERTEKKIYNIIIQQNKTYNWIL